jgi:hypothetical protein
MKSRDESLQVPVNFSVKTPGHALGAVTVAGLIRLRAARRHDLGARQFQFPWVARPRCQSVPTVCSVSPGTGHPLGQLVMARSGRGFRAVAKSRILGLLRGAEDQCVGVLNITSFVPIFSEGVEA